MTVLGSASGFQCLRMSIIHTEDRSIPGRLVSPSEPPDPEDHTTHTSFSVTPWYRGQMKCRTLVPFFLEWN